MAARNLKISRDEVLRKVVLVNPGNENKLIEEEIRRRLKDVVQGDEKVDAEFFVEKGVEQLVSLYDLSHKEVQHHHRAANIFAQHRINTRALFQRECKLWLASIYRRLSGRRSIRHLTTQK